MKNLLSIIGLSLAFLFLIGCKKQDNVTPTVKPTPKTLYLSDDFDQRGTWGCGIPCPGVQLPPVDNCNKPNGICGLAEFMPPISTEELVDLELNNDYLIAELINDQVLRLSPLAAKLWDSESVRATLLADIGQANEQYLDEIEAYIRRNVNIPKDLNFSIEDAATILNNYQQTGNSITVLAGEYPFVADEDYDNGYFDLSIVIE